MVMNHTPIENHCMRYNIKFQEIDFYGKIVVLLNCTYYIPNVFPEDLKRALEDFLQRDPIKRLGYKDNLEDFKNHPFFSSIEWDKLQQEHLDMLTINATCKIVIPA
ncbi:serine/threonine-protein kinase Sgk1-like [Argiope bruennichi]|uniref:serine/threonine-protein kinase Sgk1-like n=1 Tax=Argiope bruennichi TaxID=94029 RepID=UPI00249527E7|nr:serine/threonine-protein kinase Sgk1-like [Argiope bruennichi]